MGLPRPAVCTTLEASSTVFSCSASRCLPFGARENFRLRSRLLTKYVALCVSQPDDAELRQQFVVDLHLVRLCLGAQLAEAERLEKRGVSGVHVVRGKRRQRAACCHSPELQGIWNDWKCYQRLAQPSALEKSHRLQRSGKAP